MSWLWSDRMQVCVGVVHVVLSEEATQGKEGACMIEPPAWFQFVGLVPLFVFVVQYPDVVREYFRFVLGGGRVC